MLEQRIIQTPPKRIGSMLMENFIIPQRLLAIYK